MGITYNAWGNNLSHIFRSDGGIFSENLVSLTDFELFADDAEINDALYFGGPNSYQTYRDRAFRNLKLYVGTPFAAVSVSFVWEYWNGTGWTALDGLSDGTGGFTTVGEGIVTWNVPADWTYNSVNEVIVHWVRCRIVTITGPSEGGFQSTNVVQAGNNKILVTGTGNTWDTIRIASDAEGWGVFDLIAPGVYRSLAQIQIGDGVVETALTDIGKIVLLYWYWSVENLATLTLGSLTSGIGRNGCQMIFMQRSWDSDGFVNRGTLNFYGSRFYNRTNGSSNFINYGTLVAYDSVIQDGNGAFGGYSWTFGVYELVRCVLLGRSSFSFNGFSATPIIENCTFLVLGLGGTVNGLKLYGCSGHSVYNSTGFIQANQIVHLIDCSFDTFTFSGHAGRREYIYQESRLDIQVTDSSGDGIEGASVVVADNDGIIVGNLYTDGGGRIVTQEVLFQIRDWISGVETVTSKTPHTITISADGYQTKTMILTMDQRREDVVVLEPAVAYILPVGGKMAWNLSPANGQNQTGWVAI